MRWMTCFGLDNRVEELIWSMNTNNSQAPNYSTTNHEYVWCMPRPLQAEQDRNMFQRPNRATKEVMALVASLNPSYPPIATIEAEIRKLYDQHEIAYREEVEAQGLEWEKEKVMIHGKGCSPCSMPGTAMEQARLIPGSDARKRQASIWVWQEGDASMPATETPGCKYPRS